MPMPESSTSKRARIAAVAFIDQRGAQGDEPLVGEFQRVVGVIEQRLTQPRHIAGQPLRHVVHVDVEAQPFRARAGTDQRADIGEQLAQVEVALLELQAAGLDPREVEDVVDQHQQMLRRHVDLAEAVGLRRRGILAFEQAGEAEDGVHRRADFVAHVGEKLRSRRHRAFGRQSGVVQRRDVVKPRQRGRLSLVGDRHEGSQRPD